MQCQLANTSTTHNICEGNNYTKFLVKLDASSKFHLGTNVSHLSFVILIEPLPYILCANLIP